MPGIEKPVRFPPFFIFNALSSLGFRFRALSHSWGGPGICREREVKVESLLWLRDLLQLLGFLEYSECNVPEKLAGAAGGRSRIQQREERGGFSGEKTPQFSLETKFSLGNLLRIPESSVS